MSQRSRKQKGRGPRRSKNPEAGRRSLQLPRLISAPHVPRHVFRYIANATNAVTVSRTEIAQLMSIATTTTNQFRLYQSILVKRITMWGSPPALGSASTAIAVEWRGVNTPNSTFSALAIGVEPAYLSVKPPKDSSNRWWTGPGSTFAEGLFALSAPIGTILDLEVEIFFPDSDGAVASEQGTASGSVAGTTYYNYLDGFSSKKWTPVGDVNVLP